MKYISKGLVIKTDKKIEAQIIIAKFAFECKMKKHEYLFSFDTVLTWFYAT